MYLLLLLVRLVQSNIAFVKHLFLIQKKFGSLRVRRIRRTYSLESFIFHEYEPKDLMIVVAGLESFLFRLLYSLLIRYHVQCCTGGESSSAVASSEFSLGLNFSTQKVAGALVNFETRFAPTSSSIFAFKDITRGATWNAVALLRSLFMPKAQRV